MREAAALLADLDEDGWTSLKAVIDADRRLLRRRPQADRRGRERRRRDRRGPSGRSSASAQQSGGPARARSSATRAGSCSAAARGCSAAIGTADAVPLLQPLLRQSDPRVARAAVAALASFTDPAAARAIHTVLRAATGERPPRRHRSARQRTGPAGGADAGPNPRGERAARQGSRGRARGDRGAGHGRDRRRRADIWSTMARRKKFFGGQKLRALKQRSVDALAGRSDTPTSAAALEGRREHRRPATSRKLAQGEAIS